MNILEIKEVTKQYGAANTVLDNVSLAVPRGSIFGLLGPNGAGKTSLIRIITSITAPDTGEVLFKGEKLSENHSMQIGYLPEERGLYKKMKVGDQLLYLAQLKGLSKTEAREKLKTWIKKFRIEDWLEKPIEDLSKGMQQKVQLIATVVHKPELIILDEPFTGFDPVNANLLKDEILRLRDEGATIIFSTHRMESVEELCNYIALINHSKIVLQGAKKDIKGTYKTNTYVAITAEALKDVPPGCQLVSSLADEYGFRSEIIINGGSSRELVKHIANATEIYSFAEKIPSMNDIFMEVVGEKRVLV